MVIPEGRKGTKCLLYKRKDSKALQAFRQVSKRAIKKVGFIGSAVQTISLIYVPGASEHCISAFRIGAMAANKSGGRQGQYGSA